MIELSKNLIVINDINKHSELVKQPEILSPKMAARFEIELPMAKCLKSAAITNYSIQCKWKI